MKISLFALIGVWRHSVRMAQFFLFAFVKYEVLLSWRVVLINKHLFHFYSMKRVHDSAKLKKQRVVIAKKLDNDERQEVFEENICKLSIRNIDKQRLIIFAISEKPQKSEA